MTQPAPHVTDHADTLAEEPAKPPEPAREGPDRYTAVRDAERQRIAQQARTCAAQFTHHGDGDGADALRWFAAYIAGGTR